MGDKNDMQEWVFEHTVECGVSVQFAWDFWTNLRNWKLDADIDSIELHGEFAAGNRGVTHSKSSGRIEWQLAEVMAPKRAVVEISAPNVLAKFAWMFEDAGGKTRISQRATICGERMAEYADTLGQLQVGIPAGMQKLCVAIESAARDSTQ
jgi:hypothetical protein